MNRAMSGLVLLSKYEKFLKYMDPILQQIPKQKSNLRDKLNKFLASWLGHARWADSANLINYLEREYAIN